MAEPIFSNDTLLLAGVSLVVGIVSFLGGLFLHKLNKPIKKLLILSGELETFFDRSGHFIEDLEKQISVKIGNSEFESIYIWNCTVKNTGNICIANPVFNITIDKNTPAEVAEKIIGQYDSNDDILYNVTQKDNYNYNIEVNYLNPGDEIYIKIISPSNKTGFKVSVRQEDLEVKYKNTLDPNIYDAISEMSNPQRFLINIITHGLLR